MDRDKKQDSFYAISTLVVHLTRAKFDILVTYNYCKACEYREKPKDALEYFDFSESY